MCQSIVPFEKYSVTFLYGNIHFFSLYSIILVKSYSIKSFVCIYTVY